MTEAGAGVCRLVCRLPAQHRAPGAGAEGGRHFWVVG